MNELLINKAATIERCVARAREEYAKGEASFLTDITRQDAAILNILRVCEAALDMGSFLVKQDRLGLRQRPREIFTVLARAGWIDIQLAERLQKTVAFRRIAVHDFQDLQLSLVVLIITKYLEDFLDYSRILLLRDGGSKP